MKESLCIEEGVGPAGDEKRQIRLPHVLRLTEQAESLLKALARVHVEELGNLKPLLQNLIDRV